MARAHLFRPVTDESGNLLYGATVTVRQVDLNDVITQSIYAGPAVDALVVLNPVTIASGFVDLWLDTPERVNLLIEKEGHNPISIYLDVQPPASEVVRSAYPLTITNASAVDKVLTGTSDHEAQWGDIPTPVGPAPEHFHPGAGDFSVVVGSGATASATNTTAVGDVAHASAADATAFGMGAIASGLGSTAIGTQAEAVGEKSTAVGYGSSVAGQNSVAIGSTTYAYGDDAVSIGKDAHASANNTVALGRGAYATGVGAVALGDLTVASGIAALAIGNEAVANYDNSVAIGATVATTAIDQIALGTVDHTVMILGEIRAFGDAILAGATSTLGFFGATGATQQTVTGNDGGDLILRAVLVYLDAIGLIVNATTEGGT